MRIIKLSQSEDTAVWLEFRRGKIGGSDVKGIKPLTRGTDRTPQGFWKVLAGRVSIAPDGEKAIDRGHRIENEGAIRTGELFKLDLDLDPGVWQSDLDENIILSPDATEKGNKPTYAVENKSFDSDNHLKIIVMDRRAKKLNDYNPFNSLPKENQDQAIDYFVVNENLETLYWTLYDDRIALPHLEHYVIVINRKDIEGQIEELKDIQTTMLAEIEKLLKEISK